MFAFIEISVSELDYFIILCIQEKGVCHLNNVLRKSRGIAEYNSNNE
jgi:hypothetical protein